MRGTSLIGCICERGHKKRGHLRGGHLRGGHLRGGRMWDNPLDEAIPGGVWSQGRGDEVGQMSPAICFRTKQEVCEYNFGGTSCPNNAAGWERGCVDYTNIPG